MTPAASRTGWPLVLAALGATGACAKAFGLDAEASTLTDFCQCSQLGEVEAECTALAEAKQNDVAFLRAFVAKGCPACAQTNACYELLGASPDGAGCKGDGDCASLRCCSSAASRTCCNSCRVCSEKGTSPAPHCTPLFESLRACLSANVSSCSACPSTGPEAFEDACYQCLRPLASDDCNPLRLQCEGEK